MFSQYITCLTVSKNILTSWNVHSSWEINSRLWMFFFFFSDVCSVVETLVIYVWLEWLPVRQNGFWIVSSIRPDIQCFVCDCYDAFLWIVEWQQDTKQIICDGYSFRDTQNEFFGIHVVIICNSCYSNPFVSMVLERRWINFKSVIELLTSREMLN